MNKRKALGQHFLVNRSALHKIVDVIDPHPDELVIEIGPGKGALTFLLAGRAGRVIGIEKDPLFIPSLRGKNLPNLTIVEGDVLELDFAGLAASEPAFPGRIKLCGNLPYSISSPLLFKVLDEKHLFESCVFLLQREVAERVTAEAGSKDYAPLSILFRIFFEPRIRLRLSPHSFSPPPRVDSALVSLVRRHKPLVEIPDETRFRRFLRTAFLHRRKILANNLKSAGYDLSRANAALDHFGLSRRVRGEELEPSLLKALYDMIFSGG
jgi:16S rRNA (adenine1518-N6/adenine1519-N6)-dimethyltransferase